MRITYVAPFRVPFVLGKDNAMAEQGKFQRVIQQAIKTLNASQTDAEEYLSLTPPQPRFGNYAWGLVENAPEQQKASHGEEGIDDPSAFFKGHYLFEFGGSQQGQMISPPAFSDHEASIFNDPVDCFWQCRVIDHTVAILVLSINIPMARLLKVISPATPQNSATEIKKYDFIAFGNRWVNQFFETSSEEIAKQCRLLNQHVVSKIHTKGKSPLASTFFQLNPPTYPLPQGLDKGPLTFKPMWVHCVLSFSGSEKNQLQNHRDDFLSLFQFREPIKCWLESTKNNNINGYNWGMSAVTELTYYGRQWIDAISISQYYYACIEIADTALPATIAALRVEAASGHYSKVADQTINNIHRIKSVLNDYNDLVVRSGGEGKNGLHAYYDEWRMERLIKGLRNKLALLDESTKAAEDRLSRRNQNRIQIVLAFITMLGLISTLSGLQKYLAGGYNPQNSETLTYLAATLGEVSVIAGALVFALGLVGIIIMFTRK